MDVSFVSLSSTSFKTRNAKRSKYKWSISFNLSNRQKAFYIVNGGKLLIITSYKPSVNFKNYDLLSNRVSTSKVVRFKNI